jgi:hypothetical protein
MLRQLRHRRGRIGIGRLSQRVFQILLDETLRSRVVSKPITSIGRGLERKVAADG